MYLQAQNCIETVSSIFNKMKFATSQNIIQLLYTCQL